MNRRTAARLTALLVCSKLRAVERRQRIGQRQGHVGLGLVRGPIGFQEGGVKNITTIVDFFFYIFLGINLVHST